MWKLLFVTVWLFWGVIYADPGPLWITEYQTSPDTLERIELNYYMGGEITVVTNAGIAYVDTSLFIEYHPVVIDHTNTIGDFGLNDESDTIMIIHSGYGYIDTMTLIYPIDHPPVPAPPPHASGSRFWSMPFHDWYIDTTPTFGQPNDDYPFCSIDGGVFDQDSIPIAGAEIIALFYGHHPMDTTWSGSNGLYSFVDIGPGPYALVVTKGGYSPDTLNISTYALSPAEGVNFYLSIVGIEEREELRIMNYELRIYPNPFRERTVISYQLSVIGEDSDPITDYLSPITISIYDLTGRLIRTLPLTDYQSPITEVTWDGRDDSGVPVPAGIYFVRLDTPSGVLSTKVTKMR